MARSIHESINPVELFVPLVNDPFIVDQNVLPNLDPALRMHPPPGGDIRAFAKAPTMVKNIFKERSFDWAFSVWIKVHANANQSGPLFVVQNNNSAGAMDGNQPLYISWGAVNLTSLNLQYYGASGTINMGRSHNTPGPWTLFVFNIPQPGVAPTSFMGRIDSTPDTSFTSHTVVTAGADVYNSDLRCAIGKYGDNGPNNSMFTDVSFAKLAFHERLLTLAECTAMYNAMKTGLAAPPGALGPAAVISGGTVTTPGDGMEYHTFTSNGTLTVTTGGEIGRMMIGGGGGGGGGTASGGGGAGECIQGQTYIAAGTYPIVIGSGGNGGAAGSAVGLTGGNTTFNGQTARGGGGGGAGSGGTGGTGGQGGGGGYTSGGGSGFQYNGGNAASGQKGGGGGGAGGNGGNGSTSVSGIGGIGIQYGGVSYGGGGSGGARTDDPNANIGTTVAGGGLGGSGAPGGNATANKGAGGGGGSYNGSTAFAGGNGSSGAVVIRILL